MYEYLLMKNHEDNIVKIAKALSDKTRVRMLKWISRKGSVRTCRDVENLSGLSQPVVSHHLKILVEADLVSTEKQGRCIVASINKKTIEEFGDRISALSEMS
jgi:ArsR family transcriptional regulator, arsenate/arsenite/antimonite-responsive transcriptional repressor